MTPSHAPLGLILALALPLLPAPALAQDLGTPPQIAQPEEKGLIERGFDYLFRGFMQEVEPQLGDIARSFEEMQPQIRQLFAMIDDLRNYEAPKRLENGDILIPRRPDAPAPPRLPPASEPQAPAAPNGAGRLLGGGSEVEL